MAIPHCIVRCGNGPGFGREGLSTGDAFFAAHDDTITASHRAGVTTYGLGFALHLVQVKGRAIPMEIMVAIGRSKPTGRYAQ